MYFLVISKLPEFTPEGEVIPGQCEPYTGGWRLRLIEDGREESILSGTYYELRRVQKRCAGKSADEARKIAAEAEEARKNSPDGSPGKDANDSTQILGMDEVRRAMLEMELSSALDDLNGAAEWLKVSQRNGVAIASVGPEVESVNAEEAAAALDRAFESSEAALVIDLGRRAPAGEGFGDRLRRLAERARESGRFLGLVGWSDDLGGREGEDSSEDTPRIFDDMESAIAAAAEAHEEDAGPESSGE